MPLRTYTAEIDGLNQWIVAAPNQAAALAAFGVHQNLFAQGLAAQTTDPELVKAANAAPGAPLKRSKKGGRFQSADSGLDWSDALKATAGSPKVRKPPSRARLDKARAARDAVREAGERTLAELEAAVTAARERLASGQAKVDQANETAEAAVQAAEEAWRKAGG